MFKKHFGFAAAFFFVAFVGAEFAGAQNIGSKTEPTEKVIMAEPIYKNSPVRIQNLPVRIEEVKIGGIAFDLSDKPVKIDRSDWLKDLIFKIKNLTRKRIIYISFDIAFPETRTGGQNMMNFRTRFGQAAGFLSDGRAVTLGSKINGEIIPIQIESSKESELSLKDRYGDLVRFIKTRQPVSTINKVHIGISTVGFDDGTFWGGDCFKYDPNNPGKQIRLPVPELIPSQENSAQ